jgi:hypothetical protein
MRWVIIALLLTACGTSEQLSADENAQQFTEAKIEKTNILRIVDLKFGTVCYVSPSGAMSCVAAKEETMKERWPDHYCAYGECK